MYVTGFEYSRRTRRVQDTQKPPEHPYHDIYRHPNSLWDSKLHYNELYDIYSLGVIFLEIGLWKPLAQIVEEHIKLDKCTHTQVKSVRSFLLENVLNSESGELQFKAGSIYQQVVKSCLVGDFGLEGGSVWGPVQMENYFKLVIKKLERCVL